MEVATWQPSIRHCQSAVEYANLRTSTPVVARCRPVASVDSYVLAPENSALDRQIRPDHCCAAAWPLACEQQRSQRLTIGLSTLDSVAFGLPDYVSQDRLPHHHARLTTGRWSGDSGRAFHPQGSYGSIESCFVPFSFFPELAWRNHIDRCVHVTTRCVGSFQIGISRWVTPELPLHKQVALPLPTPKYVRQCSA